MGVTIKITREQKRMLDSMKVHPKQPYREIIQTLLEPIELPSFTAKEREDFLKKIEQLRFSAKKRMKKAKRR